MPTPPIAPVKPHPITAHGHTRIDDYYWLREKENPAVIAHLEAENKYTQAMTAHTATFQQKLYEEMVGRIQETDSSAPMQDGDYYYYSRTVADLQYNILCRKKGSLDAPEQILLDLNQIATANEYDYLTLGIFAVSPDHNILAYSLDTDGNENFVIYFLDLNTGQLHDEQIEKTTYIATWANDNKTLFYTRQDEIKRSAYLYRHTLGEDPADDPLIYEETDQLFSVYITKTRDKAYLVMGCSSIETAEQHILSADTPTADFVMVAPRQTNEQYYIGHHSGTFYILSNAAGARNFKIMTAPVATPGRANWQELIPHHEAIKIDNFDLFADYFVLYMRENGLRTMEIRQLTDGQTHTVTFPEPVYSYDEGANPEFGSETLRFTYTSLTTAPSDYDYDMVTQEWTLIKQKPVLGGYDPADYQSERIFATADDGTQVPISLVYRKGMAKNGKTPTLLYAYGSYGISIDPTFSERRLNLLDRGMIFAIAHVRGGEEMGRFWYDQGKFLHKKNTFTDFIACARHLIAEKYTSPDHLALEGRSAGGLLVGAVLNMAPELFHAAIAGVPFVDVVTTMLDTSIPLTVGEFEEWGNPQSKEYYDYMLAYSPYDNVEAKEYPNILVTAGLNDPRVHYWEPSKWVAKLRTTKTDDNLLLYKVFMGAGHFSSSGRYDYLKDIAFEHAFLLDVFGLIEN